MKLALAAAIAASLLEPSHEPLTVTIYPRTVIADQTVHVRCRVPKRPENRWVDFGIRDYRVSRNPIEGEAGPIFHDTWVTHVPCGVEVAFCQIGTSRGAGERASVPIGVIDCEAGYRR